MMTGRQYLLRTLALAMMAASCDGGIGCVSCAGSYSYPDPPPTEGVHQPDGLTGHLQESGVRFVTTHLSDILRANLPTRETPAGDTRVILYLSEMSVFDSTLTTRDGCIGDTALDACPPDDRTYRSRMELSLDTIDDAVDVTFLDTPREAIRLSLRDIDAFTSIAYVFDLSIGDATCRLHDDSESLASVHIDEISFTVVPSVDSAGVLSVEIADVEVLLDEDILNVSITACNGKDGECDDPACHDGFQDAECGVYCTVNDLILEVGELFASMLTPLLNLAAPPLVEAALQGIVDSVSGQPLALAGQWDVEAMTDDASLGSLLASPTQVSFAVRPNKDAFDISLATTGPGMGLFLDSGAFAMQSACVPTVSLPDFAAGQQPPPAFDGEVDIVDASTGHSHRESYHLAMAVSEAFTKQLAFTLYQLGSLCLTLWPEEVERLSGGAFVPTLGGLALFDAAFADLGDPNAPLSFEIHPTQSPVIMLGTGTRDPTDGTVDSLLQIDFGEVGISIYTFLQNDDYRLTTLAADVQVGINVVRTPDNTLQLALDRVAVENVIEVYNEIVGSANVADLVEVLVNLAMGRLLEGSTTFDLDIGPMVSAMLGGAPVYARINDLRREGAPGLSGHLAAYITLCDEGDRTDPDREPCYDAPPGGPPPPVAAMGREPLRRSRGHFTIAADPGVLWQVQVDGMPFASAVAAHDGLLLVESALLRIPGVHSVTFRAVDAHRYWRTFAPVTREVWVD